MGQIDGGLAPAVIGLGIAVVGGAGIGYMEAGIGGAFVGGTLAIPATIFGTVAMGATGLTSLFFAGASVGTSFVGAHAVNEVADRQDDS